MLFSVLILMLVIGLNTGQKCDEALTCDDPPKEVVFEKILTIAVLLPSEATKVDSHNLVYHNRLEHVKVGLEVIADVNNSLNLAYQSPLKSVLPGWQIRVITGDTECSSTIGPLEAFRLHCQAGWNSNVLLLSLFQFL